MGKTSQTKHNTAAVLRVFIAISRKDSCMLCFVLKSPNKPGRTEPDVQDQWPTNEVFFGHGHCESSPSRTPLPLFRCCVLPCLALIALWPLWPGRLRIYQYILFFPPSQSYRYYCYYCGKKPYRQCKVRGLMGGGARMHSSSVDISHCCHVGMFYIIHFVTKYTVEVRWGKIAKKIRGRYLVLVLFGMLLLSYA